MKPPNGKKCNGHDPNQIEFGIIWQLPEYPFRLRAGDVLRFNDGKLGRVLRVSECAAVIIMKAGAGLQNPLRQAGPVSAATEDIPHLAQCRGRHLARPA